jgi:ParB family chromosome partitioning protein
MARQAVLTCLQNLVWAAGRAGVARKVLIEIAGTATDEEPLQPIRLEAVLALASAAATPEVVAALEAAARAGTPAIRAAAAQTLGRLAPDRAAALAEPLLSDRVSFRRLALGDGVGMDEVLRAAAGQVHYQGVVLPSLIVRGDVATLAAVAEDRTRPETARLGALEGLAAMALVPAEEVLLRVGTGAGEDEDLRKAALRGVKRSRRARRKAEAVSARREVTS